MSALIYVGAGCTGWGEHAGICRGMHARQSGSRRCIYCAEIVRATAAEIASLRSQIADMRPDDDWTSRAVYAARLDGLREDLDAAIEAQESEEVSS